ncbi:MAG: carbon starvation CstA family protein [Planctomycetota bacterium]
MNAFSIALASAAALWLGYRFYGRFVVRRIYGAGGFADERMPSHAQADGHDFVPTKRSVLFGHHYVTIAGAGPIVGPAVAVTWGWLPALLWVVLGSIFIGAVHDVGALIASVRNRGRTIGDLDLAADVMTPRVRLLFLAFIAMALWVVLAVFAFVIANLMANIPASVFAVWIEVPLAMLVAYMVFTKKRSMFTWSLIALGALYVSIGIGMTGPVVGLFEGIGLMPWLIVLFLYAYFASVLPVTKLLQPRDYINSHQLFVALGFIVLGFLAAPFTDPGKLELVAPAVNHDVPAGAPLIYPFLFITIACGAISGFHCMVASGTTAKQLDSERDAQAIGYGAMILEGALAVVVILCCVSASGFTADAWQAKYSASWVGSGKLMDRLEGVIRGGAGFIEQLFVLVGVTGTWLSEFLTTVLTVVIISFAATTMDSATRIQRYVVAEMGSALGKPALGRKHLATGIAVGSAAALALLAGKQGSGGLVLWPIFGVTNQLLACLTFLVLTTWLAKRGRPILVTAIPLAFLMITVTWAALWQINRFSSNPVGNWHLITVLVIGLVLEGWMVFEGFSALRIAARVRSDGLDPVAAQLALAGPSGHVIDAEGVISHPGERHDMPDAPVC